MIEQRFLPISDAATYLGTTEHHIRKLIENRTIPYVKVGRYVRFDKHALDAWLVDNTITGRANNKAAS